MIYGVTQCCSVWNAPVNFILINFVNKVATPYESCIPWFCFDIW